VAATPVNNTGPRRAVENSIGSGILSDHLNEPGSGAVRSMTPAVTPALDCYLLDPEAMNNVARVGGFRDFLAASAQRWPY
jgi:hypothetical protein